MPTPVKAPAPEKLRAESERHIINIKHKCVT